MVNGMNRLASVLLLCAFLSPISYGDSDVKYDVEYYYTRQVVEVTDWTFAAAGSSAGWTWGWGNTIYEAKTHAIKKCKKFSKSNECEILDVAGKSVVWCPTAESVTRTFKKWCIGNSYKNKELAEAEHKRLKE